MEQPAETVDSLYAAHPLEPALGQVGDRYLEVDPAVRALLVVMGDELAQHPVEMALAPYEHPVQALGSRCPDKTFGERVRLRRPDRCAHDPGAGRPHHLVERPDELCISVTDKEADSPALVFQGGDEVTGLLGDPGPDRAGGHAGQEDFPTLQLEEEQDINAPERDRVDVEEITCEGAGGLGPEEL